MANRDRIPSELTDDDLGCTVPVAVEASVDEDGKITDYLCKECLLDSDIDFREGMGMVRASRNVQRNSQEYWLFEYLRRIVENNPEDAVFEAVVLGCVNPDRDLYAIYIHELGLEHRYLSEVGRLQPGTTLPLLVSSVSPRLGLLTMILSNS